MKLDFKIAKINPDHNQKCVLTPKNSNINPDHNKKYVLTPYLYNGRLK